MIAAVQTAPPSVAANACLAALDSAMLKALAEPARIDILKVVIAHGRADVGSIASQLPQDRSVVARHLQVLERAHLVCSTTEGRFTYYTLDGDGVMRQLQSMVSLFTSLRPLCCPPAADPGASTVAAPGRSSAHRA
jgi:DNA-binding transcriptional ArsR family regulator